MATRVLFLSASVGVGHTAAAAAVARALREFDSSIETRTVDSYRYAAALFSKVVADGYIGMVKTVPQIYRYIYDRAERATQVGAFRTWVSQFTAANLRPLIEEMRPSAVVCTHAFPCGVMAAYKRSFDPTLPVVGVVTDFVVHPFWIYRNVDAYAVATPQMRQVLLARGIHGDRIDDCGIPVDERFGIAPSDRAALRRSLDLPVDRSVVLMMGGGLGIGPLDTMMRALGSVEAPLAAAIVVGRNAGLERRVRATAERTEYPVRVFGFVDNVFDFMHASDVLVSKPGGLTSSEALAANLPMVLVRPLPGQEERNTRYLVTRKAAIRVKGERQLATVVAGLLREPRGETYLSEGIRALRRPDAARQVARRILALAGRRASPSQVFGRPAAKETP
ncbi:MAG: glycosyltransferase [Candidatus Baltobacteraceae bacterium]